jgi:hypothetical protein
MCAKNATGAMLAPRKLWLISERDCAGWAGKVAAEPCQCGVNFGLRRACPLEMNWAVQVRGLGLELHRRAKPANRDKGSFA